MIRRLIACTLGLMVVGALLMSPAAGQAAAAPVDRAARVSAAQEEPTSTTDRLPGTTLEAEERDDGTSPAPWLIGSGVAAAAAVAIGGTILKRRSG